MKKPGRQVVSAASFCQFDWNFYTLNMVPQWHEDLCYSYLKIKTPIMTTPSILGQSNSFKKPKESFVVTWESAWRLASPYILPNITFSCAVQISIPKSTTRKHLGSFLQLGKPLSFANRFASKDGETFQLILQQNSSLPPQTVSPSFPPNKKAVVNSWWWFFGVCLKHLFWVVNGQELVGLFFG